MTLHRTVLGTVAAIALLFLSGCGREGSDGNTGSLGQNPSLIVTGAQASSLQSGNGGTSTMVTGRGRGRL